LSVATHQNNVGRSEAERNIGKLSSGRCGGSTAMRFTRGVLTVIRTFATEFEANLAKTALKAARIESMTYGGRARTSDFEPRAAGVAVVVRAEDARDAEKILSNLA
jgi:hypothetical protein